jgi:hypothetical protein
VDAGGLDGILEVASAGQQADAAALDLRLDPQQVAGRTLRVEVPSNVRRPDRAARAARLTAADVLPTPPLMPYVATTRTVTSSTCGEA